MRKDSKAYLMLRMLGFVKPMAGAMAGAVVAGIAGFICATAIPTLGVAAAFSFAGQGTLGWTLGTVAFALAGLALARGVLHYIEQQCNHYIAFKLLAHIRDLVFGALRRLAPAKLAGRNRGELISTITSDIELLEVFFAHTVSPVLIAGGMTVALMWFLGSLSWVFALIALAGYALVGIAVPLAVSRASGEGGAAVRRLQGELSGYVLDSLRGLSQLIQYGGGPSRMEGLDERSRMLASANVGLRRIGARGAAAVGAIVIAVTAAQLACGLWLLDASAITPEAFAVAVVATMSSFGPYAALAGLGSTLQQTLASGERVLAILDERPMVEERATGAAPAFEGASMEDAGFAYGEEPVLEDVSVAIPAGAIVGVSGRSGSGKSTLCRLLMRFWDVQSGTVRISQDDIRTIATPCLRRLEAFVEQDTHLFHTSIRDNLLIAKSDASEEELEEACRKASVLEFVESLPDGFDTMVGELGDTLSGGERQRLGLARAFLHDAPFVLLDEPTSNLDALNEGAILKALDEERGSRTVLLVSHRESSLALADLIVEVEEGHVHTSPRSGN